MAAEYFIKKKREERKDKFSITIKKKKKFTGNVLFGLLYKENSEYF